MATKRSLALLSRLVVVDDDDHMQGMPAAKDGIGRTNSFRKSKGVAWI